MKKIKNYRSRHIFLGILILVIVGVVVVLSLKYSTSTFFTSRTALFAFVAKTDTCTYCDKQYNSSIQLIQKMEKDAANAVAKYCKPPFISPYVSATVKKSITDLATARCKTAQSLGKTSGMRESAEKDKQVCYKSCGNQPPIAPPATTTTTTTATTTAPSTAKCSKPGDFLTVSSYTPKEVSAGQFSRLDSEGMAVYDSASYGLTIKGKCLDDLSVSSNSIGIDKQPAVTDIRPGSFSSLHPDERNFIIGINPNAIAGKGTIKLSLTNKFGKKKDIYLNVNISGDQYLNRKFASNTPAVTFYGHWEPNDPGVATIEKQTTEALRNVNKTTYKAIGLKIRVYKSDAWGKILVSTGRGNTAVGFVSIDTVTLSLNGEDKDFKTNVIHEATHALHACYNGLIKSSWCDNASKKNFELSWAATQKNLDDSCAKYIPLDLNDSNHWKDGSQDPRCGYIAPYASLGTNNVFENIVSAYRFNSIYFEDVAMTNQVRYMDPGRFSKGDAASGPYKEVYQNKKRLLVIYGF